MRARMVDGGGASESMDFLVGLHSLWRWVVLIAVVVAFVRGVVGWLRGGAWTENDRTLVLVTTSVLDIQFLLGLAVYTIGKFWQKDDAFQAYIHPLVMIAAIIVVHVTSIL